MKTVDGSSALTKPSPPNNFPENKITKHFYWIHGLHFKCITLYSRLGGEGTMASGDRHMSL